MIDKRNETSEYRVKTTICKHCAVAFEHDQSRRSACDACKAINRRTSWVAHNGGENKRRRNVAHRYGLTWAEYSDLVERAGNACEACGAEPDSTSDRASLRYLSVDHDHETNEVRGLLCAPCNLALGFAHEDAGRLVALAAYIERTRFLSRKYRDTLRNG